MLHRLLLLLLLLLLKSTEIKANVRRKLPYLGSIHIIGCRVLAAVGAAN
jgi:hypothetical protein